MAEDEAEIGSEGPPHFLERTLDGATARALEIGVLHQRHPCGGRAVGMVQLVDRRRQRRHRALPAGSPATPAPWSTSDWSRARTAATLSSRNLAPVAPGPTRMLI